MDNEIKTTYTVSTEDIIENVNLAFSAMEELLCPTIEEMIVKAKFFAEFGGEEYILRVKERLAELERRNIFKRFYRWIKELCDAYI